MKVKFLQNPLLILVVFFLLTVPISVYLFTLPLPYLGVASSLPPGFITGAIILVAGLLVYLWTPAPNSSNTPSTVT